MLFIYAANGTTIDTVLLVLRAFNEEFHTMCDTSPVPIYC